MSRILYYTLFRNIRKYMSSVQSNYNSRNIVPKYFVDIPKLVLGVRIGCSFMGKDSYQFNAEKELQKALFEGDTSVINLMNHLKDFVLIISQEYRSCLAKQIEVTKNAQDIGPLSEVWDELPQYRTLADELKHELNEYAALFNIIGQMANEKSLADHMEINIENIDSIFVKFKELEIIVKGEFELNKKIEKELLEIECDTILVDRID